MLTFLDVAQITLTQTRKPKETESDREMEREKEDSSFHLPFSGLGGNICFHFYLLQSEYMNDFCVVVSEKI